MMLRSRFSVQHSIELIGVKLDKVISSAAHESVKLDQDK